MPWTRRQVKFLESSGSPLSAAQKSNMNSELHSDPAMGHHKKGSQAMKRGKFHSTNITHHDDGSHSVEHMPHMKSSKSGAMLERGTPTTYSAGNGEELVGKLKAHLGMGEKEAKGEMKPSEAETEEVESGE